MARCIAASIVALLVAVGPASAQTPEEATPIPEQSAPPPADTPPSDAPPAEGAWATPDAQAQERYRAGDAAYNDGRFAEALRLFQEAYELSARPQLLYNMGIAAMNAGEEELALDSLKRYLAAVPDAPNRELVEGRIRNLERLVAEAERARAALDENERSDEERRASSARMRTTGWALTIAGGILAAGGGVALGLGLVDFSAVENATRGTPWLDLRDDYDRAPILTGVGIAAASLGLALAITGLVLVVVSAPRGTVASARLLIRPDLLVLDGRF